MSTVRRVGLSAGARSAASSAPHSPKGQVPGAELACIIDNRPLGDTAPAPQRTFDEAVACCDLIVEAAGQAVVREWGERVLASGTDLLVASTGALTDGELVEAAARARARAACTSPAARVGGLDLLQAACAAWAPSTGRLTTTKLPSTLEQPWMDAALLARCGRRPDPSR